MAYLDIINLEVEYEKGKPILTDFNLAVDEGQLVSLLGPSGCGKTTILRTVAGFIEPVKGQVLIAGRDNTKLPPNKRDIGFVFQSYALFPHLTVSQNIAFGLQMRGIRGAEAERRVNEALELVDLVGFGDRRPSQLSGGQRQRVAVARAVVIEPKLLLLDEPLSNLDAKLRAGMRTDLRRLQQRLGITMLYVTHDQVEALAISDRIVVLNQGRTEQDGTPEEIFHNAATAFVADFMGFDNHFAVEIKAIQGDLVEVRRNNYTFTVEIKHPPANLSVGAKALAYFRPEAASLSRQAQQNSLPCEILLRTFQGSSLEYVVKTDIGEFVILDDDISQRFEAGPAHIVFNSQSLILMPDAAHQRQ